VEILWVTHGLGLFVLTAKTVSKESHTLSSS